MLQTMTRLGDKNADIRTAEWSYEITLPRFREGIGSPRVIQVLFSLKRRRQGSGVITCQMSATICTIFLGTNTLQSTSKKCDERPKCKADGAEKPECTRST